MAEPLKNIYDHALLASIASELKSADPSFPAQRFKKLLTAEPWDNRELKDRIQHVSHCLAQCMTGDYAANLATLRVISPRFSGLAHLFIPTYVEFFGLEHYAESVQAMQDFTAQCSSEFAVRVFIKKYPKAMMQQMFLWAQSEDEHVRRLASEGSRAKLPWAMAVPYLNENPQEVISLLEKLRDDPSAYVRRSVANNLNDISKDNPVLVTDIATAWLGKNQDTDRMLKHACRTLLKRGDMPTMRLFDYPDPKHISLKDLRLTKSVTVGEKLHFSFSIQSRAEALGKLRLEYALSFLLANGKYSKKVFKVTEGEYAEKSRHFKKAHNFKVITTRRFYPGLHHLSIIVNGVELAEKSFQLCAANGR